MVLGFLVGWWVCEHELVVESGGGFGPPVTIRVANVDFIVDACVNWSEGYFRHSKIFFPRVQIIVSHVSIYLFIFK